MIKHSWAAFVIFVLATALTGTTLGWTAATMFAVGWMTRNVMWTYMINNQLPGIIKAECLKIMAAGIAKAKQN